jgi:RNA polymerase sigma factor (TIGR02999 family)
MMLMKSEHENSPLTLSSKLPDTVVDELHRMASCYMHRENAGHTLQATALVNEAYLKLASHPLVVNDKQHFLALAAKQMRHVLVDHAREKSAQKRGGELLMVTLNESAGVAANQVNELIYLDELLQQLTQFDPRGAHIFELKLFSALTNPEIAELLQLSLTTVERDLKAAKAWLKTQWAAHQ